MLAFKPNININTSTCYQTASPRLGSLPLCDLVNVLVLWIVRFSHCWTPQQHIQGHMEVVIVMMMFRSERNPPTGHNALLFHKRWQRFFYVSHMGYFSASHCIDRVWHSTAFCNPVVEHWIGAALQGLSDQMSTLRAVRAFVKINTKMKGTIHTSVCVMHIFSGNKPVLKKARVNQRAV